MAPPVASAKLTLSCPLYASDFDPQDNNFLLVGGGGGEGRSGVGNKIALINTSRKQSISNIVDIDLSREEDSVTSLAIASSTSSSVIAFAGINSSEKDQIAGKNEHFRSFRLEYPPKKRTDGRDVDGGAQEYKGRTAPLGRASLFKPSTGSKKETYQRITRLSRPCIVNGGQLGAIATGLAPEGEIVLFDAKTNGPMGPWVEARLSTGKGEAVDLDIIGLNDTEDVPPGTFTVAYCTDYVVHAFKMTLKQDRPPEPQYAYNEPHPDTFSSTSARSKLRSLRFITPSLLLMLQNRPDRQGADLLLLELSSHLNGRIISRKSLHKGIKSATALSVTHLPSSAGSRHVSEHVVAVAGQDTSISIFTLEHSPNPPFKSVKLRLHTRLPSVHPLQITSLAFSTFVLPSEPEKSNPPQYLKLASTSIANTVVVHTLPLLPYPPSSPNSSRQRYVLTPPGRSESTQMTFSIIVATLVIAVSAFLLQAFVEIRGASPEYLGAKGWLSQRIHDYIAVPYVLGDHTSTSSTPTVIPSAPSSSASTAISSLADQLSSSPSSFQQQATSTLPDIRRFVTDSPEKAKEAVSSALDAASSAALELNAASQAYSAKGSSTVSGAAFAVSSEASSVISPASTKYHHIRDLISRHHHHRRHETPSPGKPIPNMIVHHDEESGHMKAGFHREGSGEAGKKFEELSHNEKEIWMERLQKAGVWVKEEGEAVLKGVFFGGAAQLVGQAVG
ncbi:MAG: hypothetical protein Q9185_001745 [Variospora sp. 1 TL-2023]